MTIDPDARERALTAAPGIPSGRDGPLFKEPWEAQAFAMVVALQERGAFSWSEWSAALGEEIKAAHAAGDPDTGETYYLHWLSAFEALVAKKGLASRELLASYHDAWARAAARTPHGTPIELAPQDFPDTAG